MLNHRCEYEGCTLELVFDIDHEIEDVPVSGTDRYIRSETRTFAVASCTGGFIGNLRLSLAQVQDAIGVSEVKRLEEVVSEEATEETRVAA